MLQMEDTDTNQTLSLLKVKEALEDAGLNPSGTVKKNIGCVLGIGGGQKSSNEFYSRMNYVVVEKVLRKMGLPETDVEAPPSMVKVPALAAPQLAPCASSARAWRLWLWAAR